MARKYFSVEELNRIQKEHPEGLTSREIVELCRSKGMRFSVATLKNYVSRGLLPRARRVRSDSRVKGKYYTSVGRYHAGVIKLIDDIKRAIEDENRTLDEIESVLREPRYDHTRFIIPSMDRIDEEYEYYEALRQQGRIEDREFQERVAKLGEVYRRLEECLQIIGDEDRDAKADEIFQYEDELEEYLIPGEAAGEWLPFLTIRGI